MEVFVMEQHHESTKQVLNRLSRAIGHLEAVRHMVEDGRDCADVLIQLSAVRAEITNVSKIVLKDHISHCITEAVREGDDESVHRLNEAVYKLL